MFSPTQLEKDSSEPSAFLDVLPLPHVVVNDRLSMDATKHCYRWVQRPTKNKPGAFPFGMSFQKAAFV